ncbi:Inner membrane protein YqiK [compost metagenome]
MQIRLKLIENLDRIIAESVKPMENIDSIKIVQVEGLNGGGASAGAGSQDGNLSDQVVSSALRYRAQAPLVDQLMAEVGLSGVDLNGLTGALRTPAPQPQSPAPLATNGSGQLESASAD